jgi:hypothetical protein
MLRSTEEITLLANAMEPGIRDPHRSAYGISNILTDFFDVRKLPGQRIIELGPGHYEFCEAIEQRGGTAEAVELDPAVAELGRRRGFVVHTGNLRDLPKLSVAGPYDGLFSKGSTNPFWFIGDVVALRSYIESIVKLVKPAGWHWIVSCPWTQAPLSNAEMKAWLSEEEAIFKQFGFSSWDVPSRAIGAFYGISYCEPRLTVYWRGLAPSRVTMTTPFRAAGFAATTIQRRLTRLLLR